MKKRILAFGMSLMLLAGCGAPAEVSLSQSEREGTASSVQEQAPADVSAAQPPVQQEQEPEQKPEPASKPTAKPEPEPDPEPDPAGEDTRPAEPQDTQEPAQGEEDAAVLDTTAGVLSESDPAQYPNGEVFVGYADGSFDLLSFETDEELAEGLERLLQDESVTLIQPNYSYESSALSVTDALAGQQWALYNDGTFKMEEEQNRHPVYETPFGIPFAPGQWTGREGGFYGMTAEEEAAGQSDTAAEGVDINARQARELYSPSRDVVVAMIDTGIDYSHEDLQNALWVNGDEIPDNGVDDDGNGYVDDVYGWNFYNNNNRTYTASTDDSHGTHGAGTVAASTNNGVGIAGIADGGRVKVMTLKALGGRNGSGSTASVIRAIRYAEENGAVICNLSLGSSVNDRALYQAMASSSMLFVVAAGNDGADADRAPSYPACYDLDNIISVANLNYDGRLHASSNYGTRSVDLAAPGSYILSTTPEDNYSYMTGTSMAAPMVTGAAALLYSHHEDVTPADVKEILLSSVTPLETLDGRVRTGGMLNVGAALACDTAEPAGNGGDAPAQTQTGTAPEITFESMTRQGNHYLVVRVADADGDLAATAYAAGIVSAERFRDGGGTDVALDGDGTVTFRVQRSGIYTFYAADAAGNETAKSVSLTLGAQTGGGGGRGGAGSWMAPPGFGYGASPWHR